MGEIGICIFINLTILEGFYLKLTITNLNFETEEKTRVFNNGSGRLFY
jgi:hypothetical protein